MARRPGGHRQAPELASSGPVSRPAGLAPIALAYGPTRWPAGLVAVARVCVCMSRWPVFVNQDTNTADQVRWPVARVPGGLVPDLVAVDQAPGLVPADLVHAAADQVARAMARGPWRRSRRQLTSPVSPGPEKTARAQAAPALARFHTLGFT